VWEITLKCNLACSHCGSRAGDAREQELTTEEALDLIRQMAECGITEVTLIGGEAYLRKDWLQLAAAIVAAGMKCTMTTGGFGLSATTVQRMKAAGIHHASVSVDGLEEVHDRLRGRQGSWKACFRTMRYFREQGFLFGANTQINRLSAPELPLLYERLRDAGIFAWQIQLTVPMGNAADNSDILLQPAELLDLYPMLARIARQSIEDNIMVQPGNNIGYYGPYERLLRGQGVNPRAIWQGCQAGLYAIGLEADGSIKGCPSLPTKPYTGGNIRNHKLRDILATPELTFNTNAASPEGTAHLWGFCQTCQFARLCRGGCSWTAHVFFNKRGNNPYCHHRALQNAGRGVRERVFLKRAAPGVPFDHGEFELVEEPLDAPWPDNDPLHFTAAAIRWPAPVATTP
jgi:nif11-class peptide radical SAM maturase 3